jgi:hypothetical protein
MNPGRESPRGNVKIVRRTSLVFGSRPPRRHQTSGPRLCNMSRSGEPPCIPNNRKFDRTSKVDGVNYEYLDSVMDEELHFWSIVHYRGHFSIHGLKSSRAQVHVLSRHEMRQHLQAATAEYDSVRRIRHQCYIQEVVGPGVFFCTTAVRLIRMAAGTLVVAVHMNRWTRYVAMAITKSRGESTPYSRLPPPSLSSKATSTLCPGTFRVPVPIIMPSPTFNFPRAIYHLPATVC